MISNILTGKNKEKSAYCRAFRHRFDGHVLREKRGRKVRWVAYLECLDCGTKRTDTMYPETCQLLGRKYVNPEDYDTLMTSAEAKKIIFSRMMIE